MMKAVSQLWLSEHLQEPEVVIVDCRFSLADPQLGIQQYEASHIPRAYYLDLNKDLSGSLQKHGGRHPLPSPLELGQKLSTMGVNFQKTLVIAYDDSRLAFASRLWWLLRYFGHNQVAVLDGGFSQWQNAGYPVTNAIPQPQIANFAPQVKQEMLADINYVKNHKDNPGVILVDSRENDRYLGIREPIDKVAGHIDGAINYPWQEVTDSNGCLLSIPEQYQRWENIKSAQEIIVYCGSGVTACVNLLSLELAGISNSKLYAGSWSDWISY